MILITKTGFHTLELDLEGNVQAIPLGKTAAAYLSEFCITDEKLTVKEFMNTVAKDLVLISFLGVYLQQPQLDELTEEVNKPVKDRVPLDYLEIAKCLDFDKTNFYCTMLDCVGWRKVESQEEHRWYDLAFVPLNEYGHLELRISDTIAAGERELHGGLTLLEVVEAFYYMISRHGPPKVRDKHRQNLEQIVYGVSEAFHKLGGDLAENLEMLTEKVIDIDYHAEESAVKPPKAKSSKKSTLKKGQSLIQQLKADLKNKK